MRYWYVTALVGLLGAASAPAQDKAGVTLDVVKYDGLKNAVAKQRGKVVLVDFWGEFWLPCKKAFPHLVEMHEKLAKEGLVVVSVALDPLEDKDRALKFLQSKRAAFTNVLLDEPVEFWQQRLEFIAPPALYVFSRQGKWTRFRSDEAEIDYAAVDKLVVELLREK